MPKLERKPLDGCLKKLTRGVYRRDSRHGGEYWAQIGFRGEDRFLILMREAQRLGVKPTLLIRELLHEDLDALASGARTLNFGAAAVGRNALQDDASVV